MTLQLVRVDEIRAALKNDHVASRAGKRIKQWREAKGWNAATLAKKAGVAAGTISGLETGKRVPLYKNVLKVLAALEKTEAELVHEEEDGPSLQRTDPLLAGLKPEDFRIARQWSQATLDVKNSVKRMLDEDERRTKESLFAPATEPPFLERRSGVDRRTRPGTAAERRRGHGT